MRAPFGYIKDRVWKRIQSWSGRWLSRAGKEIIIKVVLQAIPLYCMSMYLLLGSLVDEIHCMFNTFWWSTKGDASHGINWLKWDKLTISKGGGGMGFRDLKAFNMSLLGKQGWALINNPNGLVSQML